MPFNMPSTACTPTFDLFMQPLYYIPLHKYSIDSRLLNICLLTMTMTFVVATVDVLICQTD